MEDSDRLLSVIADLIALNEHAIDEAREALDSLEATCEFVLSAATPADLAARQKDARAVLEAIKESRTSLDGIEKKATLAAGD